MTIAQIKKKMLAFTDFYGGDLIDVGDVEKATTKKELYEIIRQHETHMEMMLSDAQSHLMNFANKIGLTGHDDM